MIVTFQTEERIGEPIVFTARPGDVTSLLEALCCFYHDDLATITTSIGDNWVGPLILGGHTTPESFDVYVAKWR